jgi:putative transposase
MLTVCTKDRCRMLATAEMHAALRHAWQKANHWLVGRYVIMPDHVHLFCAPGTVDIKPLPQWVRYWKASVTKLCAIAPGGLWQRDFWDTQLRRGESYAEKWNYVVQNPVRAGLVPAPQPWPYQGELHVLRWRA